MWDDLFPEAQAARTRQQLATPPTIAGPQPGVFDNFATTAGNYFMRGMAEAGRAASMTVAAVPVAIDAVMDFAPKPGTKRPDESVSDAYFRWHDETFQRAVDHWTPKPSEAGFAGQVAGQVMAGIVQFLANPAAAVAVQQLSTSEDLVRQGVDPGAALLAGDLAGLGTALGIAAPAALGKRLAAKMATGAGINVALNVPEQAAKQAILRAADAPEAVVAQFDPFDVKARLVDVLLGAAFGVKAYRDARLTQADRDALAAYTQRLHMEEASSPGKPSDLTKTVAATREAIDQMLRGEPVQVAGMLKDVEVADSPAKAAMRAEIEGIAAKELDGLTGDPIAAPKMTPAKEAPPEVEGQPKADPKTPDDLKADAIIEANPGLRVPVEDASGEVRYVDAADAIARAKAEAADVETKGAALIRTAAECLLGAI